MERSCVHSAQRGAGARVGSLGIVPTLVILWLLSPDAVGDARETLARYERSPEEQRHREAAVERLGVLGTPEATRLLEALLADPYPHIRDDASLALRRKRGRPDAAAVEFLADALTRRTDPGTRRALATVLGDIAPAGALPALPALPALIEALAKERDPDVLPALAKAVGASREPAAYAALVEKAHRLPAARAACIEGAAPFAAAAEWVQLYAGDTDDAVRAAVVDALALHGREVMPDLESMDGVGERTGIALAEALPKGRSRALVRRRAVALLGHPSWRVRAAAMEAVLAMGDPALATDLEQQRAREQGRLRYAVDSSGGAGAIRGVGLAVICDLPGPEASRRFAAWAATLSREQPWDCFRAADLDAFPPRIIVERAFGELTVGRIGTAADWLMRQKGESALYDALIAAMECDGVDTLCVISDGGRRRGTLRRGQRMLEEIVRRNRWRRLVVHTFHVGGDAGGAVFLANLARATGGRALRLE